MCKIGCNWSEPLSTLILNGQANVDYIKTGAYVELENQFSRMRSLKPILLHGLGSFEHTGMHDIEKVDFIRANQLIDKCNSPHYGLHLAIENKDIVPEMNEEAIHSHMSKQIQVFKKNLSVPLLLENIPDSPQDRIVFDHYPYVEAEKIDRLITENEVGLLLDLTHAKITALYRKWNLYDYLNELPLNRIREIHINGSGYDNDGFPADTHQSMSDEDYELLDWVLSRSSTEIVTLEYCGINSENEEIVCQKLKYQLTKLNLICRGR
jgi:uncharacterized protein (UPF0276 family)